jgi:hypothetical protein
METISFSSTFTGPQEVQITSVSFRNDPTNKRFESYPKRMIYRGREYTFTEPPMRYLIKKGQQLIKLLDVTDGNTQYRLRQEDANHWTLVNIKALA